MNLLNAYLRSPRVQRALSKKTKNAGFTLIELVIVVAILAILAAIGIPAFNDAQVRARVAAAKTGLATAYKECKVSELLDDAAFTELTDGGGIEWTNGDGDCDDTVDAQVEDGGGGLEFSLDMANGNRTSDPADTSWDRTVVIVAP